LFIARPEVHVTVTKVVKFDPVLCVVMYTAVCRLSKGMKCTESQASYLATTRRVSASPHFRSDLVRRRHQPGIRCIEVVVREASRVHAAAGSAIPLLRTDDKLGRWYSITYIDILPTLYHKTYSYDHTWASVKKRGRDMHFDNESSDSNAEPDCRTIYYRDLCTKTR